MPDLDQENEAKLKLRLLEVESMQIPDYPDYDRGKKWALYTGIPLLVILAISLLFSGPLLQIHTRLWNHLGILGIAIIAVVIVWLFGTFRPQKY